MVGDKAEIIREIEILVGKMEGMGFGLDKVYLYGSYAKSTAYEFSDIDVAFVSPDFHPESLKEWTKLLKLCNEVDIRIEPVFYKTTDFIDEDPLAWEVKNKGIEISITKAA